MSARRLSRRAALLGGASLVLGACSPESPVVYGPPAVSAPSQPYALTDPVTVQRLHSTARDTDVDVVFVVPEGVSAADLPVCLALHGRGSTARAFLGLGLPAILTEVVRAGTRPFAVAAVDGDHYWVRTDSTDDPQRMLSAELPGWLAGRQLRAPSAAFGISMGGFGSLRYARDHPELRAVAACSPALFTSWPDAKAREVFRDQQQWEAHEPLLHARETGSAAIGVWCGNDDPFAPAARRFAQAASPEVAAFSEGGHTEDYWKQVLPDLLGFVGKHLG